MKRNIYRPLIVLILGIFLSVSLLFSEIFSYSPKASGGSTSKSWTVRPRDHLEEATIDQVQQDETGQKVELERYFNKNLIDKRLSSDKSTSRQAFPAAITASDGSMYVFYLLMGETGLRMQKLDSSGVLEWDEDKSVFVSACTNPSGTYQNILDIANYSTDLIIVATCNNGATNEIRAQRINSSGQTQWDSDVRVNDNTTDDKINPDVEVVGTDIFVAWQDERDGLNDYNIYAQKLDSSGTRQIADDQLIDDQGATAVYGPHLGVTSSNKLVFSFAFADTVYAEQFDTAFTSEWGPTAVGAGTIGSKNDFASTTFGANSYHFYRRMSSIPANYQIYGQSMDSAGAKRWNAGAELRIGRRVVPGLFHAWNDGTNPYYAAGSFSGMAAPCGKKVDASTGAVLWGGAFDNEPQLIVNAGSATRFAVAYNSINFNNNIFYYQTNGSYFEDIYYNAFDTDGIIINGSDAVINRDFGTLNQQNMSIAKDSDGNVAAAWQDSRAGALSSDVYVQKFNATGTSQWTSDTKLNTATSNCSSIRAITNGTDIYVTWISSGNVYTGKVDTAGAVGWTDKRVNVGAASQTVAPSITWDGTNLSVIWEDNRSGDGNKEVYFNSINSSGTVQLGADQIVNLTTTGSQMNPVIRSDGTNTYVVWEDARNGSNEDIFMQKINGSGVAQYGSDVKIDNQGGIFVSSNNPDFILSDGIIYAVWEDDRDAADLYKDIYIAAFNGETRVFDDTQASDSSPRDKVNPKIGIASGNLYIVWEDERNDVTNHDIYMTRFNTSGIKRYASDSKVNNDTTGVLNEKPTITPDDAFVGWDDDRNGVTNKDIFLAKGVDLVKTNGKMYGNGLVLDAQTQNVHYGILSWTVDEPANTEVRFRTRSADTEAGLSGATWSDYYLTLSAAKIFGAGIAKATADIESDDKRYLEVEVSLVTSDLTSSPAVEDFTVSYLTNEAPEINSIVIGSTSGGSVEFYYSVVDPDNSTVLVSFEYWDGSAWKSSTNVSGIGVLSTNQTVRGVWSAGADLPNTQTTSRIRLTADDGSTFNNIGTGTSPEFMLDTTETSASATPSASGTPGPRVGPTISSTTTISASPTITPTPEDGEDEEELPIVEEIKKVVKKLPGVISMGMQTTSGQAAVVIVAILLSLPVLFSSYVYGSFINFVAWLLSLFRSTIRFGGPAIAVKKRRGYVFDNVSKRPIPLALVKVFDFETSSLVYQTYTNAQGEFALKLGNKKYFLDAYKSGYTALAVDDSGEDFRASRTDGYYDHIYYSGEIINAQNEVVDLSIPMKAEGRLDAWAALKRGMSSFLRRTCYFFLVAGTIYAILFFVLAPSIPINTAILIYYLLIWLWLAYLAFTHPRRAGDIQDLNRIKLPQAIIRVFNQDNRLIQTAVSDDEGEFILNISKGSYQVEARKAGFKPKKEALKIETLRDVGKKEIRLERL